MKSGWLIKQLIDIATDTTHIAFTIPEEERKTALEDGLEYGGYLLIEAWKLFQAKRQGKPYRFFHADIIDYLDAAALAVERKKHPITPPVYGDASGSDEAPANPAETAEVLRQVRDRLHTKLETDRTETLRHNKIKLEDQVHILTGGMA